MNEEMFKARTKRIALNIMDFVDALPRDRSTDHIGRQLLRCGTSVGANYRAACRGRSTADVISKLGIVEEEADESIFWMELLIESRRVPVEKVAEIRQGDGRNIADDRRLN